MNFFDEYLEYTEHTEPHKVFHRWSAIGAIGALLGRSYYFPFGHSRIFPNMFLMFIGDAGSRKSTAIKMMKKYITAADYEFLAADKTTKEKFLLDLEGVLTDEESADNRTAQKVYDKVMNENLWGDMPNVQEPKECFIMADEFNEFAGAGNLEFYTTLGNLWDWDDPDRPFKQRVKNTRSVSIFQPTVSILGGNTPENFARAFPAEIIGQGFLSRMILIHGERSGRKFTIPPTPDKDSTDRIIQQLRNFRASQRGAAIFTSGAFEILDSVYKRWTDIDDVRFKSYSNRRFTQLLKIALIVSVALGHKEITDETVITANTYLAAAELLMPKALGEFGKSKNSDVANKVMDVLLATNKPMSGKDLWLHVHKDLEKISQLSDILQSLNQAEKVHYVQTKGWLPKRKVAKQPEFTDWKLLTEEERGML